MALAGSFGGTAGPDEISGTKRADTKRGLGGNGRLSSGGGADEIYGNGGSDRINGNNGDDRLMVDDGNKDTVYFGCETVKR